VKGFMHFVFDRPKAVKVRIDSDGTIRLEIRGTTVTEQLVIDVHQPLEFRVEK